MATEATKPLPVVPADLQRIPLVANGRSIGWISDRVTAVTEGRIPLWWWACFFPSICCLGLLGFMLAYQITTGVGVWGNMHPVMWGWDIINFVWWIGIGHAGTLISAILFLLRQKWRTGVNRAAEAMTIFAVMCAGIYPALHVGRVWYDWWLFPFPNNMGPIWPQFRSPLMWDVFAVSTYFTVSVLFWYMGLIPDLAVMRDRATTRIRQFLYGLFSLGWTGSNRHWSNYEKAYLILAGLSTPLVLSVHSIVSFDFAVSQVPGWHTTIFPPYFVAGAIFSGFAMVQTLLIMVRRILGLEEYITLGHIEAMNKVIVLTGSIVGVAYLTELFMAWYSQVPYEQAAYKWRIMGPYWWSYWAMMTCNVISPQFFWFKKLRRNAPCRNREKSILFHERPRSNP